MIEKDVLIIGGGAAGFFAAINIAEQNPKLKVAILERGKEVLYFNLERMPDAAVRYDITTVSTVELLYRAGETAKGAEIAEVLGTRADEMVNYEIRKYPGISMEVRRNLYILGELQRILYENGNEELGKKFEDAYNRILENLQIRDADRDAF